MKGSLGYKVRTITCAACGETVTKHLRPTQRYCSLACYRRSSKPERKTGETFPCGLCGEPVYIPQNRLGQEHYFCCKAHADEWLGRHKTEHVCKICGKAFRWSPSRSKANNITYCSLACRDADPDRHTMLVAMNAKQQRMKPNHVEQAGYAILDAVGAIYTPQHVIGGKFCVDAFLPDSGTVVQFDGDYWHGNPAKFPAPDARQRRRMTLDVSQDAYMVKCGYTVIRIWASDIERHANEVTATLRRLLTQPEHTPAVHRLGLGVA